jgi:RNA polymerase sigma factor for flagellar operon FliA
LEALDEHDLSFEPTSDVEDEEARLWREFKTDASVDARARLFTRHLDFAMRLAKRHYLDRRSGDIELADLRQLASAGLLEAIDHFDPDRGVPFRGYARRRIAGSILDGISHMSELREQLSFQKRARRERVKSLVSGEMSASSVMDALGALVDIAAGLAIGFMIEGATGDDGAVEIDPAPSAYESLEWKQTLKGLMAEIDALPEKEQFIVREHYLSGLAFDQIGQALGLSKGRISQLHRAAIGRLRDRLAKGEPFFVKK